MKQLSSYFTGDVESLPGASLLLNGLERHDIDNVLWTDNRNVPQVFFSIAYTNDSILLKYFVKEEFPLGRFKAINDPVYKDSCVEFFIAFEGAAGYYNFEFNCLGTPYAGHGSGKYNRVDLPVDTVKNINILSNVGTKNAGALTSWDMVLQIPFSVFIYDNITTLNGQKAKANFYKCGDELPEPHFLSWNNILNKEPNFHIPEFFGTVNFITL